MAAEPTWYRHAMDFGSTSAGIAIVAAIVAGGCGVTVDHSQPGSACQYYEGGTDGATALGTAWIREPTDPAGEPSWVASTIECDSNYVMELDVSADDSIYVLGHAPISFHCDDADRDEDGDCQALQWLRRLSPDYQDVWSRSFDLDNTRIRAVKATEDGGAVIAGASLEGYRESPWLARFSGDGIPIWERDISDYGYLHGLAVGPDNVTVAVGSLRGDDGDDLWVIKLRGDGSEAWNRHLGTTGTDAGAAVAVDPQGHVWVVGGWNSSGYGLSWWEGGTENGDIGFDWDFEGSLVALLDPDGVELWIDESGPPSSSSSGAYAVALLPGGDAIVSTFSDEASLVRYNPSGERVWGAQTGTSEVRALAVSSAGDIFAISEKSLFHFNSEGKQVTPPQTLWASTDTLEVGMSDGLALKNDGTPLVSGFFPSGWISNYYVYGGY